MSKRPLVLFGATGFIGKAIAAEFAHDDAYELLPFGSSDLDLTDAAQVQASYSRIPEESILVMLSAISPDHDAPELDGLEANLRMARNVAGIIESRLPAAVIFTSSVDVYGRADLELPLNEFSAIRHSNYYGVSKYASELILQLACQRSDTPLTILRLPGVYGPGDTHSRRPVRMFFKAAFEGARIGIYGDGEQRRDFLFIGDVPAIIRKLCNQPISGVFNVVTGRAASLNEMARMIGSIMDRKLEAEYTPAPQIDLVFEPSRLREHFPELTFTPLEKGLRLTYEALKAMEG